MLIAKKWFAKGYYDFKADQNCSNSDHVFTSDISPQCPSLNSSAGSILISDEAGLLFNAEKDATADLINLSLNMDELTVEEHRLQDLEERQQKIFQKDFSNTRWQMLVGFIIACTIVISLLHMGMVWISRQHEYGAASFIHYQNVNTTYLVLQDMLAGEIPFTKDAAGVVEGNTQAHIIQTARNQKDELWGKLEDSSWICLSRNSMDFAVLASEE